MRTLRTLRGGPSYLWQRKPPQFFLARWRGQDAAGIKPGTMLFLLTTAPRSATI